MGYFERGVGDEVRVTDGDATRNSNALHGNAHRRIPFKFRGDLNMSRPYLEHAAKRAHKCAAGSRVKRRHRLARAMPSAIKTRSLYALADLDAARPLSVRTVRSIAHGCRHL